MKTFHAAFLAALAAAFLLISCSKPAQEAPGHDGHDTAAAAEAAGREYYTCPMHPSVISDKPGACPVCGMALVKKTAQAKVSDAEIRNLQAVSLSASQRVMANVRTEPIRRRAFEHALNAVGVIDYAEPGQATVAARFRGRIQRLFVDFTGDVVRKGQPLFELYSPDLATAERDFILALDAENGAGDGAGRQGTGELSGSTQEGLAAASRERLLVHFGLTNQQIDAIARTRQSSSTVTFYSPIHGTVVSKDVQEGQYVEEGTQLYQLADLSRVWAYLDVYEKDVASFRVGQKVTVQADAYPGRGFTGRTAFIDPSVSPQSRTVRVRVELDNRAGLLKPQMYVRAATRMRMGEALVVPRSAVLTTGRRTVVWLETEPNVFEPRDVQTGMSDESNVEILSGVSEGDMVAASGGFLLDSESALQAPAAADPHAGHRAPGQQPGQEQSGSTAGPSEDGAPAGGSSHGGHDIRNPVQGKAPGVAIDTTSRKAETHALREIRVEADAGYSPSLIKVRKGEHIRLLFYRKSDANCTGELLFPTLGIRKELPVGKTTAVELTAPESGTIPFTCGMSMVNGSVVVE